MTLHNIEKKYQEQYLFLIFWEFKINTVFSRKLDLDISERCEKYGSLIYRYILLIMTKNYDS